MAAETMKDYLVKIGWDVDKEGFNKTMGVVNSVSDKLSGSAAGIASSFVKAGGIVADVLITVNETLLSVIETTALLDNETEELARRWWTSEENARSFNTALEVMGRTENDLLYMTEEQFRRVVDLNRLGRTLEAPKELDTFLTQVRGLNHEVNRLKVIFSYGTRWVTYWVSQFLGDDVEKFTTKLRELGDYIAKNLPAITKVIAKFFETFYRLGKAAVTVLATIGKSIVWVVDLLDSQITRAILVVGVLAKALLLSPVTMFIGALLALLLLVDDYMGWKEGKDSYLDWSKYDESIQNIANSFNELKEAVAPIKEAFDQAFSGLVDWIDDLDILQSVLDGIANTLNIIVVAANDLKAFGDVLSGEKSFSDYMENDEGKLWDSITNFFTNNGEGYFGGRTGKSWKEILFGMANRNFDPYARGGGFEGTGIGTQNNTININGNDSKGIADAVVDSLNKYYPVRTPY